MRALLARETRIEEHQLQLNLAIQVCFLLWFPRTGCDDTQQNMHDALEEIISSSRILQHVSDTAVEHVQVQFKQVRQKCFLGNNLKPAILGVNYNPRFVFDDFSGKWASSYPCNLSSMSSVHHWESFIGLTFYPTSSLILPWQRWLTRWVKCQLSTRNVVYW